MKINRAIGFLILLIVLKIVTGDIFAAFSQASIASFGLVETAAVVSEQNVMILAEKQH